MKQVQFYYIACSRTLANFINTTCNNILRILYKASFTTQIVSCKRDYSNRAIMDFVNLYKIIEIPVQDYPYKNLMTGQLTSERKQVWQARVNYASIPARQ